MTTNELLQECANLIEEMRSENRLHGHITDASARWLTRLKPQVDAHLSNVAPPAAMPEEPTRENIHGGTYIAARYYDKLRTALSRALEENERLKEDVEATTEHYNKAAADANQAEQRATELQKGAALDSRELIERIAQIAAHRACCGVEHNPANGKLHGYCVVCGVPWPCEYAGKSPAAAIDAELQAKLEALYKTNAGRQ